MIIFLKRWNKEICFSQSSFLVSKSQRSAIGHRSFNSFFFPKMFISLCFTIPSVTFGGVHIFQSSNVVAELVNAKSFRNEDDCLCNLTKKELYQTMFRKLYSIVNVEFLSQISILFWNISVVEFIYQRDDFPSQTGKFLGKYQKSCFVIVRNTLKQNRNRKHISTIIGNL